MKFSMAGRKSVEADGNKRLSAQHWIEAARATLIESGVASVRVDPLAAKLGVTSGSFYWHFENRDALLASLLHDWISNNSRSLSAAVSNSALSGEQQFAAVIDVWVNERGFSPAYDAAVRDWARTSPDVRAAVRQADRKRIALLKQVFLNLGYDRERAEVRARIMYYHQVGHYALGLEYPASERLKLRPLYVEALRDGVGRRRRY